MTEHRPWAVIAGGGTAGHVHPAMALATELVARGHAPSSLHFIGSARGIETELVPPAGFTLTALPGRGLARSLSVETVRSALALVKATWIAFGVMRRARPKVLVSVGGYASVPAALAAVLLRIPIVVMEQNAVPGAANRLIARWAKASAASFANTPLPRAVHTGNPCRPEILAVDRTAPRADRLAPLGIAPDRRLLVAFGGSLGARRINQAVIDALPALEDREDLAVRHIIGDRDWPDYGTAAVEGSLQYRPVRYEAAMHDVYAAADLLLCRAGATSVAEIAATGTPAVLIPLPGAPGDHQTLNARALTDRGGAMLVADADLDAARVVQLVDDLLDEPDALHAMGEAARAEGRPHAVRDIADLVEAHARA